ncbi:MAG: ABC transporter ATP-binding protein [Deltaproteobacteria bacterium]|nr:ABC transporter ATP-binding protein [Deltaproteobacteria bacterium]
MPTQDFGSATRSNRFWNAASRFGALRTLGPFLADVWRVSPGLTSATISLRIFRALLPILILFLSKLIIDAVVVVAQQPATAFDLESGRLNYLLLLFTAEFAAAVLMDVIGRAVSLIESLLAERLTTDLSIRMLAHASTLDLQDYEDSELQDRIDRARRQTSGRAPVLGLALNQAQDLLTVIGFAVGLVAFAPWLLALLFVALVPALAGELYFNAQSYDVAKARTHDRRELDYVRHTGASTETAKEVQVFGLTDFLIERYRSLAQKIYAEARRIAVTRAVWGVFLTAIGTAAYYGAYAYIAWSTLAGRFTVGDLVFLAASFRRMRTLGEGLLVGLSQIASQSLYLEDLYGFFDLKPTIVSSSCAHPFPATLSSGVTFDDVGFMYPGASSWAVRHLSFTLRPGESVALVGENGAGKTTVVKLMARLYDATEGRILIDGRDIREYDVRALRNAVGVIFQDYIRYSMTARDNIAVGQIDAKNDENRIETAARKSLAAEIIRSLPLGYGQMLGKRFKAGIDLSGGEWQKVAIARAYMRDAQILILDEPTASLDARSEFEVFKRFKELSKGKITVLISHRFSNVRIADKILVMSEGGIEAQGTHDELLAEGGRHADLFELQAAGYR